VEFSRRSHVNPNTICRFEAGRDVLAGTLRKIEETFQAAGVKFVDDSHGFGVVIGDVAPMQS
jgi:hypothetical protein